MGYYNILAKFLAIFPQFMETVRFWQPGADKNSIRVEMTGGKQYQFSYWNDNEWDLAAVNTAVRGI